METIRINRLRLENFKCHRLLELELQGRSASIYGDNASGKTSVYDALTWLLFGKDSKGSGEKNIDLKPLGPDGQVADHEAITAVEAEFSVDGAPVTLRRTLREVWSAKRGSSTTTYDGNTSEYFVDGVPMKKYAYDGRIADMVSEDTFRLMTSVSYFAQDMGWRDRREILFRVAGTCTDREILAADARFFPLAEAAGNLPLEDYKKKLLSRKKGLSTEKTDIPARISENQGRLEQYDKDYSGVREQRQAAAEEKAALEQELAMVKGGSLLGAKRNELEGVRLELRELESRNKIHRAQQGRPDQAGRIARELESAIFLVKTTESQKKRLEDSITRLEAFIQNCREDWGRYNAMTFQGATCPTCGQAMRGQALERAEQEHRARVAQGKAEALERANRYKEELSKCREEIGRQSKQLAEAEERVSDLERQQEEAVRDTPKVEDLPEYASRKQELQERADALNGQVFDLEADISAHVSRLRADIRKKELELEALDGELSRQALVPELKERIEALRAQAAEASRQLEGIEEQLYLLEEFTRFKTRFIEDGINSRFRLANFRLFREQANGGLEERCDVTFRGVPYGSLNSGAKINVGIDIINTLSQFYGVMVPLFVDNAESVTRLQALDGELSGQAQVIRLVVSERDKELRCE